MRILAKTDDSLVLVDDQADKRLALKIFGAFLLGGALFLTWEGMWEALPVALAGVVGLYLYAGRSRMQSTLAFDRVEDSVRLSVEDRNGAQSWTWKLGEIDTAQVHSRGRSGSDSGFERPDLLLKDGTRVPVRPYHSAGTQSWHVVAAVKLFLGQRLDDAPVGWLPPEEFDIHFGEEMARLYK
ncbi:MAG: hypothetical protein ACU0DK_17095 [Pseudooceanicola sp.]